VAPESPAREGYTFNGWNVDFTDITGDLAVTAQYEINKYTVTFMDWDETVLETQAVEHGSTAVAPESPAREGYTFKDWNADFSDITGDLTVAAQYEINKYFVTFVDWNGSPLDTQIIEHGYAASAPKNPTREGYTFKGWNADFSNIIGSLFIAAQYDSAVESITPTVSDEKRIDDENDFTNTIIEDPNELFDKPMP
jgi:uncharacterized repeat protein (TIGR02543 family)